MIAWLVSLILPLMYGVEFVDSTKNVFVSLSAAELMVEIFIVAGFFIAHVPDVLKKWRGQKRRNRK
jgi:hypothetical protein